MIADNVGDNVGDCAGMAADLFETFLVTGVAAMLLGYLVDHIRAVFPNAVLYPAAISGCGILATVVGTLAVRMRARGTVEGALCRGLAATLGAGALGLYLLDRWLMRGSPGVLVATLTGLGVVAILIVSTHYYTSRRFRPVGRVAEAAEAGAGPVVITGMSVGLRSVWLPGVTVVAGMLVAFFATGRIDGGVDAELGLYGIGLAATSMLAVMGMIVSIDAFGPIADNAGGIAEMAALRPEARAVTDALDAVGNTTKAITKGYAIGSAALAALTLFAAYTFAAAARLGVSWHEFTHRLTLDDPLIVVGLLLGALLPFVFASSLMKAVGVAAQAVVFEVRRQFADIPGLARCREGARFGLHELAPPLTYRLAAACSSVCSDHVFS